MTNAGRGGSLNTYVTRTAMEAYLNVTHSPPARMTVAADALQEFAGTYRRQFSDVAVTVDGDALKFQVTPKMPGLDGKIPPPPPPQRLGFLAKDRLLQLDGPNAGEAGGEFVRDGNGRPAWLRTGRIHRRVTGPAAATAGSRPSPDDSAR